MNFRRLFVAWEFVALLLPASSPAQPVNPVVREGVTEKISAHVYVIPDASVPMVPNVGIIVGANSTLVIDTGMGVRNGQAVLREVAKVSSNKDLRLAVTHFHPEHDLGAMAFPEGTWMYRARSQQKDIEEFGLQMAKTFSARSPFIAELLKDAQFRQADEYFDKDLVVDLGGGVQVLMIAMGANHTNGDTAFLVQPDGVLFSGDIVMKPQPAFASPYSSLKHWLDSLFLFEKLQARIIVPSHGPMGDASMIAGYRTYLTTIRDRTMALKKAGQTVEQAVELVTKEFEAKYPDKGRLGGAIRAAYREAAAQ